ncbi:PAS domain-containing protein [uncultured Methylobacterium sp.]|uniref:PAS domain-containing protein n=1 Tax=uncultured Methylobacterium sp. TaxID=157278 RepID=UPI0035CBCA70
MSAYLVLDGAATRILHASAAAAPVVPAIAGADGTLHPGVCLSRQILGVVAAPRLVRLRLDPRRIAPPVLCVVARGDQDGDDVLLLLVTEPLPVRRRRMPSGASATPVSGSSGPVSDPAQPAGPFAPTVGDRFVWRSDADDVLTVLSGPSAAELASVLVGRSWAALARAGQLSGADAFLDALSERRTFRGASAVLSLDATGPRAAVDLSAARLGRRGEAFAGFGGYGVVRAVTEPSAVAEAEAPRSVAAVTVPPFEEQAVSEVGAAALEADIPATLPDARLASWPPALPSVRGVGTVRIAGAAPGRSEPDAPLARPEASGVMDDPAPASIPAEPAPPDDPPPSDGATAAAREGVDAALSVTEHAAFREIARALGARYAGDDEGARSEAGLHSARSEGGAVMPFPVAKAPEASSPGDRSDSSGAEAALLEALPTAILVHRGDAVLAANRRFLALTGYADLETLRSAGIGRLFRGLSPDRHGTDAWALQREGLPVLIETADAGSRPVAVEHGPVVWHGEPAACLIVRAVPASDPAGEHAAAHVARAFREGHAAEARATLDALDDGVVTLDAAGRVVAMNRAAAALFACDPREVVGTGFPSLFEAADRDAVRASVAAMAPEPRVVAVGPGLPVDLRVSEPGPNGIRAVVLRARGPDVAPPTPSGLDRPAFFGLVDRGIRAPVDGILGLVAGMLPEPFGPIDERYRDALCAIKASGEAVLGLVADLSDLATIQAGDRALTVRPLPLNDLVSSCVALLQPEAARGRVVLRTSFSPDLAALDADEPSMRQAALTVIADAIRVAGAGGQVIVSTMPGERGGAALKVRGTGPGPRSEEGEGFLEPPGTGPRRGGTALGLPLSRALVEANHGRLNISSKDEGTLVEILLPGPQSRHA